MNKKIKYLVSIILIVTLLCASIHVQAAGDRWVEFTNEKLIAISVKKVVTGDPAPAGDQFKFQIKLGSTSSNVKNASKQVYKLYDSNGKVLTRWINSEGEIYIGVDKPDESYAASQWETDAQGMFCLKSGQRASFEGIPINRCYEVSEVFNDPSDIIEDPDFEGIRGNYTKLTPDQKGTLTDAGAALEFKNMYEDLKDELKIYKHISYNDSFPVDEDDVEFMGVFDYTATLDGVPMVGKEYSVYKIGNETGEVIETGYTDKAGHFSLQGGQYAVFKDVKKGAEVVIRESCSDSAWWAIGSEANPDEANGYLDVRKETVPASISFQNTKYSFVVTKKIEEDKADPTNTDFIFELHAGDGSVMNAQYYLYESNGKIIDSKLRETADGRFTLKAKQSALFVGIKANTKYSVKEIADFRYEQKSPDKEEGYTDKTVIDGIENNIFVNKIRNNIGFSVKKTVIDPSGQVDKDKDYHFIIYKQNGDTKAPLAKAYYNVRVNGYELSRQTDENGGFTLKENQIARFKDMWSGKYYVEEIIPESDLVYFNNDYISSNVVIADNKGVINPSKSENVSAQKYTTTNPKDSYAVKDIPLDDESDVSVEIINTVRDYYFNIEKLIHVDSRTGSTDNAQAYVFRIDYLGNNKNGDVIRTFYTDIKCTNFVNDVDDDVASKIGPYHVLEGKRTLKTNMPGWYRVTECSSWSDTDFGFVEGTNAYKGGKHVTGCYEEQGEDGAVYFQLEKEYSETQVKEEFPTAQYTNAESEYAFRSGQAYADNLIK